MDDKKQKELDMWKTWKDSKDPLHLKPLLKSLEPIITVHVNKMSGNLPKSAIRAEMIKQTIKALDRYDPAKSQLNTFIYNTAGQKLHRYIYEHQNMGKIPEPRIVMIGTYQKVKTNLADQLGRDPEVHELADELKWSQKQIKLLEKEMRKDLIQDANFSNMLQSDDGHIDDRILMLHSELMGRDKTVLEYVYGLNNQPQLSNSEIAARLGISPSMVTQIKNKLAERLTQSGTLRGVLTHGDI